jgi:Zn-dependent protease with chaperone function
MSKAKKWISVLLIYLMAAQTSSASVLAAGEPGETTQKTPRVAAIANVAAPPPLDQVTQLPSLEIARLAERFTYPATTIQKSINARDAESKKREKTFKAAAKQANKEVSSLERQLAALPTTTTDSAVVRQRKLIHCRLIAVEKKVSDDTFDYMQRQIATDVQIAKLQLLQTWPGQDQQVKAQIQTGTIGQREFGNVLDIGRRGSLKPFRGQQDDIAWGKKEMEQARRSGLFPKEFDDPVVKEYVNRIAQNLARNSDLQVPLNVYVVRQDVVKNGKPVLDKNGQPQQVENAMALPGGYLIIYAGLIKAAANESELAGVMAHEMAHVAARHSRRLANKGRTFNILSLSALIGLQLLAPGLFQAASYLGYYLKGLLLQGIFNGLGIVFTLDALGVSRDFELEADQLGMQYAWKAGYDPAGFIDLFDQMSEKEGYASRTSFFATHPAFGQRTLNSLKEYRILESITPGQTYTTDTSEFQEIRERVQKGLLKTKAEIREEENRPSLNPKEPSEQECRGLLGTTSTPAASVGSDGSRPASSGTSKGQGSTEPQAFIPGGVEAPCAALPFGVL